jgi:biopolymer transport protein ExbB/TolQ
MIKILFLVFLSVLFINVLFSPSTSSFFAKRAIHEEREKLVRPVSVQDALKEEEKRKESDSSFILFLKELSEKLGSWLRSLNEKIEKEDITRFEVRFYEVLRSILEWVKEKIDAKIKSSVKSPPQKKEKGILREIYRRDSLYSVRG